MVKELGERLRSYRIDAGVDLKDLAARTRISSRHLKALEEGRFEELPGIVFVRGFVRSLCAELGRDPDPLLRLLTEIENQKQPETVEPAEGPRRIVPLALTVIVMLFLVVGGILIHGAGERERGTPSPGMAVLGPQDSDGGSGPDASAEEESRQDMDLLIRAIEKTWLRVQTDSSEPWETTMKTGDEIRLKAVERYNLFIGNAGGILFELNGRRFGPPGSPGQVISNYVITRDNL